MTMMQLKASLQELVERVEGVQQTANRLLRVIAEIELQKDWEQAIPVDQEGEL